MTVKPHPKPAPKPVVSTRFKAHSDEVHPMPPLPEPVLFVARETPASQPVATHVTAAACPVCGTTLTGNRCEVDGWQMVDS